MQTRKIWLITTLLLGFCWQGAAPRRKRKPPDGGCPPCHGHPGGERYPRTTHRHPGAIRNPSAADGDTDPHRAPTVTPDLRLPPEQWRQWPIVPTLTNRAHEIYQQGLVMGNNPHHFSKIGDCQMIVAAFFGMYGTPGMYAFPKGEESLQRYD